MQSLHDKIVFCDYTIWYLINVSWQSAFMDTVAPFLRNQWFWAPLYLFLLIFMPSNFGKNGWFWCLGFLLCFAIGDQVSAHFIKPYIHRLRPCNNPVLQSIVHLIVPCGSGYSFPSSHATNHFALGVFSAVTLQKKVKWIWPLGLLWAASVSYAQVYVGVHFPLDVFCGGLLGAVIGLLIGFIFNKRLTLESVN
jgi:membrane-associated phospholipid phosphatase